MITEIFNISEFTERRKLLREQSPETERLLWKKLKGKKVEGYKFRRQYGINIYVVDFYCPAAKLVIEVDGSSHDSPNAQLYDRERQKDIEALGLFVLRFTNDEVRYNLNGVLEHIHDFLSRHFPNGTV